MYHRNNVKTADSLKRICNPCPIDCRSWTRRSPIRKHSKDSETNGASDGTSERLRQMESVVYVGVDRYTISSSREERHKQTRRTSEDEGRPVEVTSTQGGRCARDRIFCKILPLSYRKVRGTWPNLVVDTRVSMLH